MTREPCAQCGRIPAADTPGGLCPACLLQVGLAGPRSRTGETSRSVPTPAELNGMIPDLEILELLGTGGMGVVYRARQMRLDRIVAVKILSPDIADSAAFAQRFEREARALAQLSHPNIVAVHDFGETGGMYYLVMELVEGTSLRRVMKSGAMSPRQALAIVPMLCEALQFAHDRGVVHRDIKPENVLLTTEGEVKVADFGLAKTMQERHHTTVTAGIIGTPAYMAPEQIEQPHSVDHRADIYSLGVVFYEMLTGELPLGRFAPPSHKVRLDLRLDEVVLRTLEKERERRYQRVEDVRTDVNVVVGTPQELPAGGPGPHTAAVARETAPQPAPSPSAPPPARYSGLARLGAILSLVGFLGPWLIYGLATRITGHPFMPTRLEGLPISVLSLLLLFAAAGGLLKLAGAGCGIAGVVAIRRSEGALRGMWMAVLAIALPVLSLLSLLVRFGGPYGLRYLW